MVTSHRHIAMSDLPLPLPTRRIPVAFDMETRDPDDALTLCLLATHPAVELLAVTATPGTPAQLGVIREILRRLAVDLPIGARAPSSTADAVSPFHYAWLGTPSPVASTLIAHALLAEILQQRPECTLLTGAPLHTLHELLVHHPELSISRWVAQGGFAGDNLVPASHRLEKFAGLRRCESYNFGHNKTAARAALTSPRILQRRLVSKNVTHGVAWDQNLDRELAGLDGTSAGLRLMREAMALYLHDKPLGKLLHDPLAAVAAIDPGAFEWREVEVTYAQGRWGAEPAPGSGTFITVAVDRQRALATLVAPAQLTTTRTLP